MYRTSSCGQLTISDVGKEVTLSGWVASRRDHGKLVFIDLRDRFGLTQVVFIPKESGEAYAKAQELRSEFVVTIKGTVNPRPKGTINPKLPTGEVEILAREMQILNPSLTPPFEIREDLDVTEEMRLKYRYLDLRRKNVFNNFQLRHKLYKILRPYLNDRDFIEVETPILTKSTPEGARDYLVPSRLNAGQFFALPQSPQLFKQLLMVSGIERYYQIAKCFRDEDLRADRQPEFTQMDIEMSFITEDDIFTLIEGMMKEIFKALKGVELVTPFRRITHKDAMEKYGCDKPDLRKETACAQASSESGGLPASGGEFAFVWVTEFPMFKFNAEEKRWESEHHPFTAPSPEDIDKLESDSGHIRSRAYDLVLNGTELGSGSIRIHRQELQERIFKIIGLEKEEAYKRFGFLLEAFQYGAPPHGGFAFGVDRLLAIIAGEASIREVIAFPKTAKAFCPLTSAPSDVDPRQLTELNIAIKKK